MTRPKDVLMREAADNIAQEILEIMFEYDEQNKSASGVDTPGGLEHMGDVWRMLDRWREELVIAGWSRR